MMRVVEAARMVNLFGGNDEMESLRKALADLDAKMEEVK